MKKFYLILLALIFLVGIFFFREIKEAANIVTKKKTTPLVATIGTYIPIDVSDPIYGNPGAPVTVIEFNDFGCKKCSQIHEAIIKYVSLNPQKARLVWKSAPIAKIFSPANILPHRAAYCAGEQNKFWQFTNITMLNAKTLVENDLKKIAEGLKLDTAKWWTCYKSDDSKQAVASSTIISAALGVKTAPTIFVNNHWINLEEDIKIEEILKNFTDAIE